MQEIRAIPREPGKFAHLLSLGELAYSITIWRILPRTIAECQLRGLRMVFQKFFGQSYESLKSIPKFDILPDM
jgi:hypothetical protein